MEGGVGGDNRGQRAVLCEPPCKLEVGANTSPSTNNQLVQPLKLWPPARRPIHSAFFASFMRRNFIRCPLHSLRQPVMILRIDYAKVDCCMDGHPLRLRVRLEIHHSTQLAILSLSGEAPHYGQSRSFLARQEQGSGSGQKA